MQRDKNYRFVPASFTVEAALVFPLFLFAALALVSIIQIMQVEKTIQHGLLQTAKAVSMYAYAEEETDRINAYYLQTIFLGNVDKKTCPDSFIKGGYSGISFYSSSYRKKEEKIKISATYKLCLRLPFFEIQGWKRQQNVMTRAFVGKELCKEEQEEEQEQFVYVAEHASVYHFTRECSHLRLKISEVAFGEVGDKRNLGGGKYQICEHCGMGGLTEESLVYIAAFGERYHCDRGCSGLKRSVRERKLSETAGLHACSRCGR